MKIATSFSTSINTVEASQAAYTELEKQLGGPPTWMTVHTTFQHPGQVILAALHSMAPDVPFQGGTTCLGVMTEKGFHSENGVGLGLFGIRDPEGCYGIGNAEKETSWRQAGKAAMLDALQNAGKCTTPPLVWITCAPGAEEDVLSGIEEVVGPNVPIFGGSSADNTIEGKWYQFTHRQMFRAGVVVTVMYPSKPIHHAFSSSYSPTFHSGMVTKATGRTIYQINRRPAAEVYNEWTNGIITDQMNGGNILAPTTLHPLGRVVRRISGVNFYQLSHPEAVVESRALALFTNVNEGEKVFLMEGSTSNLINRVDVITFKALQGMLHPETQIAGALIIYCAGCMLAVQNDMQKVAEKFSAELGGHPFLGGFTFGEQGSASTGENRHANLMMSIIVFEQ